MAAHQEDTVEALSKALKSTRVSPSGVSFAGKSLKLNTADDAKEVVKQIDECPQLEFLNLQGNTLGVDAAKAIAESLEKHPEFKQALWRDMFTGRMKTEIPKALEFLGNGLVKAQSRLTELDLSDNAFGPIGVEGLAALLRSPCCYALQELWLNNNGLGITGGKLLASALTDCYNHSAREGKPLSLKVFVAGRNRLENDGAIALAEVFKKIQTLENISMPQNGIYYDGIAALAEAFSQNKNLKVLDLNDNTFGEKGAEVFSNALIHLENLTHINLGDCLLKNKGAFLIAKGLSVGHENLEELNLESNEIKKDGGVALVSAMCNKIKLKSLNLDLNQLGDDGAAEIREKLDHVGMLHALCPLSENMSAENSDEESDLSEHSLDENEEIVKVIEVEDLRRKVTIEEFLDDPSGQNLILLGEDREHVLLQAARNQKNGQLNVDHYISVLMKVASLSSDTNSDVADYATKITEIMYKELFSWAKTNDVLSTVNNCLLVSLGLIKSEDKSFKPTWNLTVCLNSLKLLCKGYDRVPESTRNTVTEFIKLQMSK